MRDSLGQHSRDIGLRLQTKQSTAKYLVAKCELAKRTRYVRFMRGTQAGSSGMFSMQHSRSDRFGMKQLNAGGFVPDPTFSVGGPRIHVRRMPDSSDRIECRQFAVPAPRFETGQFKRGCEPRIRLQRQGGIVLCK